MRGLLSAVAKYCPRALIDGQAFSRLSLLSKNLPELFDWLILETRFGAKVNDRSVDALLCITRIGDGWDQLGRWLARGGRTALLRPARDALASWRKGGLIARQVPLVWLEFDLHPTATVGPLMWACVDAAYPLEAVSKSPPPHRLEELAARFVALSSGRRAGRLSLETLRRCAEALPAGARLLHLGSLRPRGRDELRAVAVLRPSDAAGWLKRCRWPGDPTDFARLLNIVQPRQNRISLQVDLGATIGDTVAIEYYVPPQHPGRAPWRGLFRRLREAGLCTLAEATAAVDWVGHHVHRDRAVWGTTPVVISRQLDVKVVLARDGFLSAKGYLAAHAHHPFFTA